MASLSSRFAAPRVPEASFGGGSGRTELDVRAIGAIAGWKLGGRTRSEVGAVRCGHGGARVGVRASSEGATFNGGANAQSFKAATPQVIAASGVAAPVVEDPADVDLVVDPPPKPEPVPSDEEFLHVMPDSLQYEAGKVGGISEFTVDLEGASQAPSAISYLTRILTSRVYDVAIESPLEDAKKLSERLGVKLLLKREDMQPVFSFKLRGAYNMMSQLPPEQLQKGVICSSAGNHAQGVALAARKLNCDAVIAMPVTTPEIKWKSVKRLGATVVLVGDSYDETQAYAKRRAVDEGRVFVPPFDHPEIIAGQGTIGMEIVRQHSGPLHAVFVPVGGGGLIAGIAAYMKQIRPEVKIIGVEPVDANAMALSLHHGKRIILNQVGGFADGVAVKMVGEETFRVSRNLLDGVVLVNRDSICAAIKDMFEETRSILEPAGALSLAGAKAYCQYYGLKDEAIVAITSGANMNFDRLRVVTELADVGARKEAVLATFMPEEPGSFKKFQQMVGPISITEFKYRYTSNQEALVLYSVGLHKDEELSALKERMKGAGMRTINLTNNDLAKDHLRHLMGGRAHVEHELLYRFVFPERQGALMKFLDAFSPSWNITLFHYRSQGEMGANVLVALQIAKEDEQEFVDRANALGYEFQDECNNEAFQLILR